MSAYRTMECGFHGGPTLHEYTGDCWRCMPCEQLLLVTALRNLRCVATSHGVSEEHGVIVNADRALQYAEGR